jgi:two-component system, response regulator PdtaR
MLAGGDGRVVLIVQEELLLRMDAVETFEEAEFSVFQVSTAEEAIVVLQREPTIRMVFTDIDLPGSMDGLALAHYVRHRWPPTILLVSSGRPVLDGVGLPSNTEFVRKPYMQGRLAKAVQGTLSQIAASDR